MLENMALPESNEEVIPAKLFRIQFARFISTALSPATVVLPFVILVAFYTKDPNALISVLLAFFFLSVGPMGYIFYGVKTGKFTDADVSVRSQRTGPFIVTIASSLIGSLILEYVAHGTHLIAVILQLIAFCGIIMMIVTCWWKISMHASAIAAAVTTLTMLYGKIVLPAFLLLIAVSWSRVVLHRHTKAQVIAGSLVGIVLTFVLLKLQGI
jgi:membrane-associated phospholipid phosphatase